MNTIAGHTISPMSCAQLLGPDRVLDAQSDLAVYECDAFVIEKHCPNVAVFPKTTAEVAAIVKLCNEQGDAVRAARGGDEPGRRRIAGRRRRDDRAHADARDSRK